MTPLSDEVTTRLVRDSLRLPDDAGPATDLWPRLYDRIQAGAPGPTAADWILVAAVAALCLLEPSAVIVSLFHF